MGIAYTYTKEWDRALYHLEKVLLVEPAQARAHLFAGLALGPKDEIGKAIRHMETAISLMPVIMDSTVYAILAGHYMSLGRYAEAVAALEKAMAMGPDNAALQNNLGNAAGVKSQIAALGGIDPELASAVLTSPEYRKLMGEGPGAGAGVSR